MPKISTIGIFAPASALKETEGLTAGINFLETLGFKIKLASNLELQDELCPVSFFPGRPQERIDAMMQLWSDPEVDILLAMRGGYGCMQLLDKLDYDYIKKNPKPVLGYSDLTALFAALYTQAYNSELELFHTPILLELPELKQNSRESFINLLEQLDPAAYVDYDFRLNTGTRVLGGNLSLISSLVGTRYLPNFSDSILFLEDCKEPSYKIEKMFYQLEHAGCFDDIAELQLGIASEAEYPADYLSELAKRKDLKIRKDIPVGHGETNLSISLG